ncbi:putative transmembrane protein 41B-like [Forsythia ovata]|uniref:Transmembrane protein 41B-like n=1 Tax=Forsythia ovata TaxID=205694 RepID=A0ABD1U5G8_9LAMI
MDCGRGYRCQFSPYPRVWLDPSPKKFHFLKTLSSLRETKKEKPPNNAPQGLRRLLNFNPKGGNDEGTDGETETSGDDEGNDTAVKGTILAGLLLVGVVGGFGSVGYIYKDQINAFLTQFSGFIEVSYNDLYNPISRMNYKTMSEFKKSTK